MQYHAYEMAHALITPMRIGAHIAQQVNSSVFNPLAYTPFGKSVSAACQVFEGVTRRYGKPAFGIDEVTVDGLPVAVTEEVACYRPFGDLLHFRRGSPEIRDRRSGDESGGSSPKVLIIAPMSGHYATLLRGTVRAMIPEHDVYITDWRDARNVPLVYGRFDFHDFVDYVIDFLRFIGPDTHVIAVCQPSVPVLAAAAVMARAEDPCQPLSLTLMGGPIDTRKNPTEVNKLAQSKDIGWFERNVISHVPLPHAGAMRKVYPGFIQLSGFMTMNLDRHMEAHWGLYQHLIEGDCDSVGQHRKFYEEYLAVMDLSADFYLQTVEIVFQQHLLPDGKLEHRGEPVDCSLIEHTTLMTVEGEKDDICGLGQTGAAHTLCTGIPEQRHIHYVQPGVGHYGVFNGTRWRTEIQPRIAEMIRQAEAEKPARPKMAAKSSPREAGVGSISKAFSWA